MDNQKLIEVRALRKAGLSYTKIGNTLGLNRSTVAKRCQTDALIADIGPRVKTYKGYFTGPIKRRIRAFLEYNPLATLADIILGCELVTSTKSLCYFLNSNGLQLRVAKKRIILSDANRAKRVAFCERMLGADDDYIKSIWFSDETMVKSRPNGELVCYRLPQGQEWSIPANGGGSKSVMLWSCISINAYGPLVEVRGKNTSEQYIETLTNYLLPEIQAATGRITFQQDNATIHKTAVALIF